MRNRILGKKLGIIAGIIIWIIICVKSAIGGNVTMVFISIFILVVMILGLGIVLDQEEDKKSDTHDT